MRLPVWLLALSLMGCTRHSSASRADSVAGQRDSTVLVGKTRLQAFQAKTGSVVVLGFSKVATVPGLYGGTADIEARELTDAASGARASGLGVEVTEAGELK